MEPEALFSVGPPLFYPTSWVPKSYLKSSKFTKSILTHGRWSNTTLDEATNLRQREQQRKERTMQKMARMSDKFRWEVQEVERIQKQVSARQHRIARANLCTCCAIMIQATWRTHQAKTLAKHRRGQKLGHMLVRWWRGFKIRRNVAIVKQFIIAAVSRRRRGREIRWMASVKLQRAWRRHRLRTLVGRIVLASAATEIVIEDVLVELARRVYVEIKGAIIARAWKKSKTRSSTKNRKGRGGRAFLTQGGASSPRRKPGRAGVSRNGLTSDPSSYPSRRSPPARAANKRKTSFTSPAFLDVISAATNTAAVTTATERRGSSPSSEPPPPLSSPSNRKTPPKDDYTSGPRSRREKSGASVTSEMEGENDGDLAFEKTTAPQPRRPSGEKPSRTSEGRSSRSLKFAPGIESESDPPPSATPDNNGKGLNFVTTGERGTAAGLQDKIPIEVHSTTAGGVADSSQESAVVANRSLDGVKPCGDGLGNDGDIGHLDEVSSILVEGRGQGEAKMDKEDYASDTFESLGEVSLTR